MIKRRKLIDILDDRSVDLSRLATLLRSQQDELESIEDGGKEELMIDWTEKQDQIYVISNMVMQYLKRYSKQFTNIVDQYHIDKDD